MSQSTKNRKRGTPGGNGVRKQPVSASERLVARAVEGGVGSGVVSAVVMRQVGLEVLREDFEPAAWARALVEAAGTRDDTLSHYARIRAEELTEREGDRRMRKTDLEIRRKGSFKDFKSVPRVLSGGQERRKILGSVDAVFWHLVAMVAGVGTLVAAQILWPGLGLGASWAGVAVIVLGLQLIPLAGWRAGRGGCAGVTYSQATQMAACLAVLASVVVGCRLFTQEPERRDTMADMPVPASAEVSLRIEQTAAPDLTRVEEPAQGVVSAGRR